MIRLIALVFLLSLTACAATGVPQEQAAQYQQAAGYPYNSFYCP